MSMATMIELKLVNVVAYEPLVLTRCKSKPMRRTTTAATAKVVLESCFMVGGGDRGIRSVLMTSPYGRQDFSLEYLN
ncbi:hypothetical protein RND71_039423 [Anisodus tanguticus]|uniref:Uncharacterized protein n=1 Tax=Anisodus tanguticus TaxID=243964 RepID=A0AAE1QZJ3_9SOLA|nr:hypothetical protein RND71_039423 [Anisodus tanguticus]